MMWWGQEQLLWLNYLKAYPVYLTYYLHAYGCSNFSLKQVGDVSRKDTWVHVSTMSGNLPFLHFSHVLVHRDTDRQTNQS